MPGPADPIHDLNDDIAVANNNDKRNGAESTHSPFMNRIYAQLMQGGGLFFKPALKISNAHINELTRVLAPHLAILAKDQNAILHLVVNYMASVRKVPGIENEAATPARANKG